MTFSKVWVYTSNQIMVHKRFQCFILAEQVDSKVWCSWTIIRLMTGPTLFLNGTNVLWCNMEEYQNYQMKYHSFHIMVSQEIMEIDSCLFRPKLYLCNLMLTKDIYRTLLRKKQVTEKCVPDAWEVYYIVVWYYPVVIKTLPFGLLHKHTVLSSEISCCKLVQYIF